MASKFALTETYVDVEKLIYYVCHRFRKRYGGDFYELLSQANEIYMDAYHSHDPKRGTFPKHLQAKIWGGMLSSLRTNLQRNKTVSIKTGKSFERKTIALDGDLPKRETTPFDESKLEAMTEDARYVVGLALHPTKDVSFITRCRINKNTTSSQAHRLAILEVLNYEGWSKARIKRAFTNARDNL